MVFMTFSLSSLVSKAQGDGRQSPFPQGKAAKKEHTIWITDILYATRNTKFRRVVNVTSAKNERKYSGTIVRGRREGERARMNMYLPYIHYPGFIHETHMPCHPENRAAAVKVGFWVTITEVELFVQVQRHQRPWQSSALVNVKTQMTSL